MIPRGSDVDGPGGQPDQRVPGQPEQVDGAVLPGSVRECRWAASARATTHSPADTHHGSGPEPGPGQRGDAEDRRQQDGVRHRGEQPEPGVLSPLNPPSGRNSHSTVVAAEPAPRTTTGASHHMLGSQRGVRSRTSSAEAISTGG